MADERTSVSTGSGLSFAFGLVAGAAIGVGLALLFAPKSGAALRRDMARTGRRLQEDARDQYERVAEAATELSERGRDAAQRAKTAVATRLHEAASSQS